MSRRRTTGAPKKRNAFRVCDLMATAFGPRVCDLMATAFGAFAFPPASKCFQIFLLAEALGSAFFVAFGAMLGDYVALGEQT